MIAVSGIGFMVTRLIDMTRCCGSGVQEEESQSFSENCVLR